MKLSSIFRTSFTLTLVIISIFIFSSLFGFNFNAKAVNEPLTDQDIQAIQNSDCPQTIKNLLLDWNLAGPNGAVDPAGNPFTRSDASGTFILGKDANGNILIECASGARTIETLVIKLVVMVTVIVVLVAAFAIAKSSILMITAFEDSEKFKEATKSLTTSIVAIVGTFFAYLFIIFIMTGVMGLGTVKGDKSQWNIVCQQRLVFQITFSGDINDQRNLCN